MPVLGRISALSEIIRQRRDIHEVILSSPGLPEEEVLKVIYECEKELVAFRLHLSKMIGTVIKSSMNLLGIEVPERM